MSAQRSNNRKTNSTTNNSSWWIYAVGLAAVGSLVYYVAKKVTTKEVIKPSSSTPGGTRKDGIKLLDLDIEPMNGTSPTSNITKSGDGNSNQIVDVLSNQMYKETLLKQRRFSSVLKNPYLKNHGNKESYHHLGLHSSATVLETHFKRTKFVLIVRSPNDVRLVSTRILKEFPQFKEEKNGDQLPKPIGSTDRYTLVKIASIVIVSCGIGAASMSILLQEITKLLVDAGAFTPNEDNSSLRFNTSYVEYILLISAPGIKISPLSTNKNKNVTMSKLSRRRSAPDIYGRSSSPTSVNIIENTKNNKSQLNTNKNRPSQVTVGIPVILPTSCYNEKLSHYRDIVACGEIITNRQMKFDRNLISDIKIRCSFERSLKPKSGKGLSVKFFNEALSHNSVAIQQEDNIKAKFIQSCIDQSIKYIDMESGFFAAFCNKLSISCVSIVGIEYDIATPNKSGKNIRVSHQDALQATLDIFCQYLWDRISNDKQYNNIKNKIRKHSFIKEDSEDDKKIDHLSLIDRSRSQPNINMPKKPDYDDAALPAFNNSKNIQQDELDEGS